jgi:osmotically-inducible protein OsmY
VKDATVTAKVKSKLLWNRNTNGLEIDVSTDGGVVTLKGEVASDAQRELAVLLAKNTTGVQRVKDRLEVVPEAKKSAEKGPLATLKAETSDAWISSKVQSMLLFSKETEGAEIDVSTTGQVVTLKGTVSSKQQEQEILNLVASVTGVTGVRSELIVEQ